MEFHPEPGTTIPQ